jgi:hypothetical protein
VCCDFFVFYYRALTFLGGRFLHCAFLELKKTIFSDVDLNFSSHLPHLEVRCLQQFPKATSSGVQVSSHYNERALLR